MHHQNFLCHTGCEPYQLLSWSNEEACLLAAASQNRLHLFSLHRFFALKASAYSHACASLASAARSHAAAHARHHTLHHSTTVHATSNTENEALTAHPLALATANVADHVPPTHGQSPQSSPCTMPPPSASGWDLVATLPLQQPLLALSWTLQGGGLLLSDTDRNVTMLRVRLEPGLVRLAGALSLCPPACCCDHKHKDTGCITPPNGALLFSAAAQGEAFA